MIKNSISREQGTCCAKTQSNALVKHIMKTTKIKLKKIEKKYLHKQRGDRMTSIYVRRISSQITCDKTSKM